MIDLGPWIAHRHLFAASGVPTFAHISGGRTSAMMAALTSPDVVLLFQNTGREHPRTYEFLERLAEALDRAIIWLEFRPPRVRGARPRDFEFAVVSPRTAARDGSPFLALMQALADYRAGKGLPPVAPWARGRLCTSYLKHRVSEHYIASLGIEAYEVLVGLRADEPDRVHRLMARETAARGVRCPLNDAGITKPDVLEFWSRQSFDLELQEHQGNCTGCFLKDQTDLARVLGEDETDADWWIGIEREYPRFGGQRFAGYARLRSELPLRLAIERDLRAGDAPTNDGTMEPRRFRLVVKQEQRRIAGELASWSCSCESAEALADADAETEERWLQMEMWG